MVARRIFLTVGGALVLLAVIGAVYLEILVQSRSTHHVWMATQDVVAGSELTAQNVRRASVPDTGDSILYYRGNPISEHRRAGHALSAGHLLADDDLMQFEMVRVPVTFKAAPPLRRGDTIDVYTVLQNRTIQVGRSLTVETPSTIWVPAPDEPAWVTLQANGAPLFAVASSGVGVPSSSGLAINDAVSSLAGSASGRGTSIPAGATSPSPKP